MNDRAAAEPTANASAPPSDAAAAAVAPSAPVAAISERVKALEEKAKRFKAAISASYVQLDDVCKDLAKLKKDVAGARRDVATSTASSASADRAQLADARDACERLHRQYVPETGSLFTRLFLGQVNVKLYREHERIVLKKEYQKFKERTNLVFLVFVATHIVLRYLPSLQFDTRAFDTGFQVWLLYLYVSLALREHILKVNGSNIRAWWIIHHYLSIAVSLVVVMWSDARSYHDVLMPLFMQLVAIQGVVQTLITRYQTAQLYRQIAMGEATQMDVVADVPAAVLRLRQWLTPSAMMLLPFLLLFQGYQVYVSYRLLSYVHATAHYHWQPLLTGVLFAVLGFGNVFTTLITYWRKDLFPTKKPKAS